MHFQLRVQPQSRGGDQTRNRTKCRDQQQSVFALNWSQVLTKSITVAKQMARLLSTVNKIIIASISCQILIMIIREYHFLKMHNNSFANQKFVHQKHVEKINYLKLSCNLITQNLNLKSTLSIRKMSGAPNNGVFITEMHHRQKLSRHVQIFYICGIQAKK